ncbi:MAG: hypothetical protein AAB600_05425 [Patescibacteria group bacterium]
MEALTPVVTAVGGYILGVFTILVTRFGEGGINEFYENRKKTRGSKNKMGEEIRSFCIEGMHNGFSILPGSEHHIQNRAAYIDSIDSEVGGKLRKFLTLWVQTVNMKQNHPHLSESIDHVRNIEKLQRDAQNLGEELLAVARKWEK